MFSLIAAVDNAGGIGKNGGIPWNVPEDMKHFRKTTSGHVVIMGSKTFASIGKLLPNRDNIIISKSLTKESLSSTDSVEVFDDLWKCVKYCCEHYGNSKKKLFVIGGEQIYHWFMHNNLLCEMYITYIPDNYECDKFLFTGEKKSILMESEADYLKLQSEVELAPKTSMRYYKYINRSERKILDYMIRILDSGDIRKDRTGTGIKSIFGASIIFDLENNAFPLMTTRKMFLRGIFEELMLYLRGQTDNEILVKKGIHVWTGNTTREFLDSRKLQYLPVGDMGHSYGFSFRHRGANYINCKTDYFSLPKEQQGYDQLTELINEIKTNSDSRRLIIDLWEPEHMHKAALPPCLYNYQFDVTSDGKEKKLSCMMTQRSSDLFLAGGWNIATGSLLTIMLAHICGMKPGKLVWNIGNMHIYNNLFDQTTLQIDRTPYPYPRLFLKNPPDDICNFEFDNLELVGYQYHPPIKGSMNI